MSELGTAAEAEVARIIDRAMAETRAFLGAEACDEDAARATALLPILHAVQAQFGCVSAGVTAQVADALNISRAEVRGVVSFYHDFRSAPAGERVLRLCRAEACQAMGCERLVLHLESKHGLRPGDTAPDGSLTLENVYCLGNCALGPAALLDGELVGRLDEARIDALVREGGK